MNPFPNFQSHGKVDREFSQDEIEQESLTQNEPDDFSNNPPIIFGAVAVFFSLVLLGTLFYYQVGRGGVNFLLAEKNRIRLERILAPRGIIFDRNGEPLVGNAASYELSLNTKDFPKDKNQKKSIIQALAGQANIDADAIEQSLDSKNLTAEKIVLKNNLSQDDALRLQVTANQLPGVAINKAPIRRYPHGDLLAHVLGFVGKPDKDFLAKHPEYDPNELVGKSGIENVYEQNLKGKTGQKRIEVDAQGRLQRVIAQTAPEQGSNVELSLDLGLEKILTQALKDGLAGSGSGKGAALALDPKNGQILALVSLPSYDNNTFISGDAQAIQDIFSSANQPLVNRAIAGVYPSGSSIKPLWAAAALSERVIDERLTVDTPQEIKIGEFTFPDWKDHGSTNIKTAIAESNNIFFYALAGGWGPIKGLGINKLVEYMKQFGFGEKTGIDLTGEQAGFVPSPAWKKKTTGQGWFLGDTYHLAIGQGDIAVTPLQLLVAQSAIYNGGNLVTPHFAAKITDKDGNQIQVISPSPKREGLFSDDARRVVRQGMRQAVTSGSARASADLVDKQGKSVEVAAKTGTAQFGVEAKTHAWFVAFAPWQNPQIGIIVIVEGGGEGHAVAQPVAKKALEWWFGR